MNKILRFLPLLLLGAMLNTCALNKALDYQTEKLSASGEIAFVSWNIQDFGQTKNDEEIYRIANVLASYDLVAIQEVVAGDGGVEAVQRLLSVLNRSSRYFDFALSEKTESSSVFAAERYLYLWKKDKLKTMGEPSLLENLASIIEREPYQAWFISIDTKDTLSLANFHATTDNPEREVVSLSKIVKDLKAVNTIICGDFNLNERNGAWDSFYKNGFQNALTNSFTSLKKSCREGGYLSKAYDNIYWKGRGMIITEARVVDFVKTCRRLDAARELSDHLPIAAKINFQKK